MNLIFKSQKYQNLELSPGKRSKLLWFESPILRQKLDFCHENWIIWYFLDWNIVEYWRKIWNMYLYISMSQSKILSKVNFWTKNRDLEKCGSVKREFLDKNIFFYLCRNIFYLDDEDFRWHKKTVKFTSLFTSFTKHNWTFDDLLSSRK